MIEKGKKEVPAKVEEITAAIICDLCGLRREGAYFSHFDGTNWASSSYEVNDVCIKLGSGRRYPEGSFGKTMCVDMCPDCFRKKLVPWLKSQGATIHERNWDYD